MHHLQETEEERSLRTRVFVQGAFRWYVSVIGFIVFFVIGAIAIPKIFPPVKVRFSHATDNFTLDSDHITTWSVYCAWSCCTDVVGLPTYGIV
jgi:hypothetical protein